MTPQDPDPQDPKVDEIQLLAGFLDDVAARTHADLPEMAGVAVTLSGPDGPITGGASNALAAEVDSIQYDVGTGPCLRALETGAGMYVTDLAKDPRWGDYGPRAAARGVRACVSVPVSAGGRTVAVLKLYASQVDGIAEHERLAATGLARELAGSFGLAHHVTHQSALISDLESAMASRRAIDLALGIVMAKASCGPDDAFAMLRHMSQTQNRKLRDVAAEVVSSVVGADVDPTAPFARRRQSKDVADFLLARLREWGVEHVFGYPGDGINGLLAAWGRADNHPRFVQARHEEMAAFSAVGYAKFTGRLGVCVATSGPGGIHLLNGLYDAKLDHVPLVAIVGQTDRSAIGGSYQQEVDLLSVFKDVASAYVHLVTVPERLPNVLDRAVRTAMAERTPTAVIVPADVQELEYSAPTHAFKMVPSSLGTSRSTTIPDDDSLRVAADILNAGSRVAILAGQGARGARAELEQVADVLGGGVAKALLGKDVLPDDLPFVTGSIGLLGTRPSYEMMTGCDTLLTVGSNFPYTQFLPELDQARAVQIDIDAKWIGMRYPYEVNLVGDAARTLRALLPMLERKDWFSSRIGAVQPSRYETDAPSSATISVRSN